MQQEESFESGVSFFIWRTVGRGDTPGHAAMRMYRPSLAEEFGSRGMYECVKLVSDGMRSARMDNTKAQLNPHDDTDFAGIMKAKDQLYLSFWPGGEMPKSYNEDMMLETGSSAREGLEAYHLYEWEIQDFRRQRAIRQTELDQLTSRDWQRLQQLQDEIKTIDKAIAYRERGIELKSTILEDEYGRQVVSRVHKLRAGQVQLGRYEPVKQAVTDDRGKAILDMRGRPAWEYAYQEELMDNHRTARNPIYEESTDYGTEAEAFFTLPCLTVNATDNARNPVWGLSIFRMAKWWKEFLEKNLGDVLNQRTGRVERQSTYNYYSTKHNCAGACVGAMHAGGAAAYVPYPGSQYGIIATTPNDVEKWATLLDARLDSLNAMTPSLRQVIAGYQRTGGAHPSQSRAVEFVIGQAHTELLSAADFKAATNLKSTLTQVMVRHGAISTIDSHLAKYHRIPWELETGFTDKLACMVGIVTEAHGYFQKYRNNPSEAKRGAGVALLVKQVFDVLKLRQRQ